MHFSLKLKKKSSFPWKAQTTKSVRKNNAAAER